MDEILSKETLSEIAKFAIAEYLGMEAQKKQKRQKAMLHNTKTLLENYRKLKVHKLLAVDTLDKAGEALKDEAVNQLFHGFGLHDRQAYPIAKTKATTAILIGHMERMLEAYRLICENSPKETERRRWRILYMVYLDDCPRTCQQVADELIMDIRAVQRELSKARDELKVLLFGAMALDGCLNMDIY